MPALSRREVRLVRNWLAPVAGGDWSPVARSVAGAALHARAAPDGQDGVEVRVMHQGHAVTARLCDGVELLAASEGSLEWHEGAARAYLVARLGRAEHRFPVPHRRSRGVL